MIQEIIKELVLDKNKYRYYNEWAAVNVEGEDYHLEFELRLTYSDGYMDENNVFNGSEKVTDAEIRNLTLFHDTKEMDLDEVKTLILDTIYKNLDQL